MGIHTSNFRDFILKPEILRAVVDCGFEHPSEGEFLSSYILSTKFASCGGFWLDVIMPFCDSNVLIRLN